VTAEHTQERLKELTDKALGLLQLGDSLANDANTIDRRLLGIAHDIRDLEKKKSQFVEIRHEVELLETREMNLSRYLDNLNISWEGSTKRRKPVYRYLQRSRTEIHHHKAIARQI
jgi:hypothetical protein